jgi:predicted nuclease of predicted toxin-antitoxin system
VKVLVDSCVPKSVVTRLRAEGHEASAVSEWPEDPGDDEILARAAAEQRVLITLDRDFGELAVPEGHAHAVPSAAMFSRAFVSNSPPSRL